MSETRTSLSTAKWEGSTWCGDASSAKWHQMHKPKDHVARALAIIAILVALASLAGCSSVSQKEYRALVEASEAYRNTVGPVFVESVKNDRIPDQSKKNRLAVDEDFGLMLASCKVRAGMVEAPKSPTKTRSSCRSSASSGPAPSMPGSEGTGTTEAS